MSGTAGRDGAGSAPDSREPVSTGGAAAPAPADAAAESTEELRAVLAAAARRSGFARVEPGQRPTAHALWGAVGGVRGLVESLLPGFLVLIVFTITEDVTPSVLIPVAIAVLFVIVRAVMRSPLMPAVVGFVGIALSAGLALFTGRAEESFIPGLVINSVWLIALLVSLFFGGLHSVLLLFGLALIVLASALGQSASGRWMQTATYGAGGLQILGSYPWLTPSWWNVTAATALVTWTFVVGVVLVSTGSRESSSPVGPRRRAPS